MKRISLLVSVSLALIISGCKEKGPIIDFGGTAAAVDTTYVAAVETAQAKNVMVEEFTGASCSNCPKAAEALDNIGATHDGHLILASLHIFNVPPVGDPYPGSKYDFRTQKTTDIGNSVYGHIGSLPYAGIDRSAYSGTPLLEKSQWATAISDRFSVTPDANVTLITAYDNASRKATVKMRVAYTKAQTTQQYITALIVEDSITDIQETLDTIDHQYNFMHIVRDYLTPIGGNQILASVTIDKGRVYERTFTYTVNVAWKPEHCKVIGFVHNYASDNKQILQTAEVALKP